MVRYASDSLTFRPLEEADIKEIAERQPESALEMSELLDNRPRWAPLSSSHIKERISEEQKKPHTAVFAIYWGNDQVGMGEWSASWSSWSPYAWFIIWPKHRRAGLGKRAAAALLDMCFREHPGHVVVTAAADWNDRTIKFVKGLGFREIGRMRRTHVHDGEYRDTLFFDILKPEYMGARRGSKR